MTTVFAGCMKLDVDLWRSNMGKHGYLTFTDFKADFAESFDIADDVITESMFFAKHTLYGILIQTVTPIGHQYLVPLARGLGRTVL